MSAARAQADILLTISSDVSDLRKTQEEFVRAKSTAMEFAKIGTAFAAANQAVNAALSGIKAALKGTIVEGVQFNAQLEQAQLGVASVLKQFNPEKYQTFNQAIKASTGVIEELKKQAAETPATFEELLEGFQSTAGAMASANIPLEKQVGLVVMASQAMTTYGISTRELRQEVTALLMGNIDRNARLAQTLQITNEDIKTAKEQGRLYEFLAGQFAATSEGARLAANNITVLQSNLQDATTLQAADATKQLTESYRGLLRAVTDLVKSNTFKEILERASGIASIATDAVAGSARLLGNNPAFSIGLVDALFGTATTALIVKNVPKLATLLTPHFAGLGTSLGQAVGVGFASAMVKAAITEGGAALDAILDEHRRRIETFTDTIGTLRQAGNAAEVEASIRQANVQLEKAKQELADWQNRTAIWQNTAYGRQELERINSEISQYQRLIDLAREKQDAIIAQNRALAQQRAELTAIEKINADRAKLTEKALEGDAYQKAWDSVSKLRFSAMTPEQQLSELRKRVDAAQLSVYKSPLASDLAKLDDRANPTTPTAENERAAETLRLQATARLLELQAQLKKIEEQITREKERQAKATATEAEKAFKLSLDRQEIALQQSLNDISQKRAAIEANTAMTTGEKRRANIELIRRERAELELFINTMMSQKNAATSDVEKQLIQGRIDSANARLKETRQSEGQFAAEPIRGVERFNVQLRQMAEDGDAAFEVLNAGFNGLQAGLLDALKSAKSFGDGFKKILSNIGIGIANAIQQIISMRIAMGIVGLVTGGLGAIFSGGAAAVAGGAAAAGTAAPALAGASSGALGLGVTATPAFAFAGGGSFVTSGPTKLTVGDNPGGVELVSVIPISGKGTSRLNGRNLAMAGGGTALIDNMRISRPPRLSFSRAGGAGDGERGDTFQFNYNFQTGVTRQEVAALIPVIEQRTMRMIEDNRNRRRS